MLAERESDLLPVPYYHIVFTLPAPISDVAYRNEARGSGGRRFRSTA
jgi:hypothetical protein